MGSSTYKVSDDGSSVKRIYADLSHRQSPVIAFRLNTGTPGFAKRQISPRASS
jgi:hypothetical protein